MMVQEEAVERKTFHHIRVDQEVLYLGTDWQAAVKVFQDAVRRHGTKRIIYQVLKGVTDLETGRFVTGEVIWHRQAECDLAKMGLFSDA